MAHNDGHKYKLCLDWPIPNETLPWCIVIEGY